MIRKAAGIFLMFWGILCLLAYANEILTAIELGESVVNKAGGAFLLPLLGIVSTRMGYRVYTKQIK